MTKPTDVIHCHCNGDHLPPRKHMQIFIYGYDFYGPWTTHNTSPWQPTPSPLPSSSKSHCNSVPFLGEIRRVAVRKVSNINQNAKSPFETRSATGKTSKELSRGNRRQTVNLYTFTIISGFMDLRLINLGIKTSTCVV